MFRPCSRLLVALTGVLALSLRAQPARADTTPPPPVFDLCATIPVPCDLPPVEGVKMANPVTTLLEKLPPKDCVTTGYEAGPFRYAGYVLAGFATMTSCTTAHTLEAQVSSVPTASVTGTSHTTDNRLCLGVKECNVTTSWAAEAQPVICYENEGATYYTDDNANTALATGSVAGVICV